MTRVAVVGTGAFGSIHARKFAEMEDVELVGVMDTHFDRAEAVGEANGCMAFADWNDLLKYSKPEAVSIVAPTQYHYSLAWLMMQRGLDVFIEKPMAERPEEAAHLNAVASATKCILQVGHIERFNPVVKSLRHDNMRVIRCSPYSERVRNVNVVMDLMIHDIDMALSIFGTDVTVTAADGTRTVSEHIDWATAVLEFSDDIIVKLSADRSGPSTSREVQVGEDDYIDLTSSGDPLMDELRSFVDCVQSRETPAVTGEDGMAALVVAHQILEIIEGEP